MNSKPTLTNNKFTLIASKYRSQETFQHYSCKQFSLVIHHTIIVEQTKNVHTIVLERINY